MNKEELKIIFSELSPAAVMVDSAEWLIAEISAPEWSALALALRNRPECYFDYLFCVTCVDWKTHLTMVYHLTSTMHRHTVVIKANLKREEPVIETVSGIWRTAEFHEREAYELFGVHFANHPDLRLLILPDGWEGRNPMRKDYEDAINIIKL